MSVGVMKDYKLKLLTRFYYESIKRELKRRLIYEYRCDERLKTKNEESTRLSHTELVTRVQRRKYFFILLQINTLFSPGVETCRFLIFRL